MGCEFTPWILADPIVLPEGLAESYSESVAYLPDAFVAASPIEPIEPPEPCERGTEGLAESAFVFCNFCHSSRIGPETFDVWMRILDRTAGSVLWLYDAEQPEVRRNLALEAEKRGVDRGRLVFAGRVPRPDFLSRLSTADLFLDTLGYNAGATGVAALGAGLPIVTAPGSTYLGRMGASLCRAAGVEEMVTTTVGEYEDLAVALAGDREAVARIGARLTARGKPRPLFDLPRFASALESAYAAIWRCHVDGKRPKTVRV